MATPDNLRLLAANHRWVWHQPTRDLLNRLPGSDVDPNRHPVAAVDAMSTTQVERWLGEWGDEVAELHRDLTTLISSAATPAIAYFSPEFGVAAEVRQYSGGLGILAGDHLKSASDLSVPLVGIGLLYRGGFFHQTLRDGVQGERYETIEPVAIGADDTGAIIEIPIGGRNVKAKVWRQMVGASQLLLLDTDHEDNTATDRAITDRLYSGDRRHRLDQELVLGVGGVLALRALDLHPEVFHLNEGHACFLLLELLAEQRAAGLPLDEAVEVVRSSTLFTTHTPVPAGIDRFERTLVEPDLEPFATRIGLPTSTLLDWATLPSDPPSKPFNTAALAFELCGRANGVSLLHASVSRDLFASLPRAKTVEGLTNGVHARTWVEPAMQALYDRCLGPGWEHGAADAWARIDELDRAGFDDVRRAARRSLVELVADRTDTELDPERCLIGFARRFATYKRATLLLRDPDGLRASLAAGAQFVFAGKAHPADDDGKAVLAELVAFAESAEAKDGIVLLPDYDIGIAQAMYAGCDVWLNNPVRPQEACGTSGEKAALNGGLNCSILDGWWADWHQPGIGWVIPTADDTVATDDAARDLAEAEALHRILTDEVLPRFANPAEWWATTLAMLAHLGPRVTAGRMVAEYDERFYQPIRRG